MGAGSQGLKGGPSVCYEIPGGAASKQHGKDRHLHTSRQRIGHVELKKQTEEDLKCWTCGREGHLRQEAAAHAPKALKLTAPPGREVCRKTKINGHLVGAEVARFLESPTFKVCVKFRQRVPEPMYVYHSERSRSSKEIKRETYLDPAPRVLRTVTEKIDIHGKLKSRSEFGDATYQHAVYVADIADPFILGLDFLKGSMVSSDFNKNE
ncbi:hypothetical protein TNCV_2679801 [Trichonephila clavipes]|nr:hypothetical protein TNCV_2679801 [Trichonephila clavipes]